MAVNTQLQFRRGTAAQWTSTNPTLAAGEFGYETDTGKAKVGNGSTAWNSLSYAITGANGTVTSVVAGTGLSGGTITGSGTIAIDSTVATLTGSQTLTNKTLTSPQINLTFNAQTGTTYTFALSDNGQMISANNASAQTYTIPPNSSVAFPDGTQINVIQTGAGQVTFAQGSGVTIVSTGASAAAPKLRVQYSSATLIKRSTDLWYVVGDIS